MPIPEVSVRARLLLLCCGLVVALATSNLLLGYLIKRDNAAQVAQQEQFRRLQICQAVEQTMTLYRHRGGAVNTAILIGNEEAKALAQQGVRDAYDRLQTQLNRLASFDPDSAAIIRHAVEDLPAYSLRIMEGVKSEQRKDTSADGREFQRRLDLIEDTIREASRREHARVEEIQMSERDRVLGAVRLANLITLATSLAGIGLTLLMVRSIIRPLQETTIAIRHVNAGHTDIDLPPISNDEFGDIALALRQFRDQAEHLRQLAYWDPLTGLGNRAQLEDSLRTMMDQCRRTGTGLALMYIDLDNFRAVNDRLGHQAGDRYLCEAVSRLSRFIPPDALLCRYAGDNFTVVIEGVTLDAQLEGQLRDIAECALRGLAEPYPFGEHMLNMSASIGIAVFPRDGDTVEKLILGADAAMYAAKKNGRNNIRFAAAHSTGVVRRQLAVANEIRLGIDRAEFEPYYQPIVDIERGRVVGAEALLRWRHPLRGLLMPGEFIQIAEEEGLVGKLGLHCLMAVHRQSRRYGDSDTAEPLRYSVNLSVRQLQDRSLLQSLQQLSDSDAVQTRIDFEITESALLDSADQGHAILSEIRAMGFRLGLDDFGTGYSSFSYLHKLPVDKLKIDRQFVANMSHSKQAVAIISAIVALARSLELDVIAEGVETAEQMEQLRRLGCSLQQGYHFTAALPAIEFERWVEAYQAQHAGLLRAGATLRLANQ